MQSTYRWHGTPERTGSLFFVPQLGPPMQRSRQPVLLGDIQEVGGCSSPMGAADVSASIGDSCCLMCTGSSALLGPQDG